MRVRAWRVLGISALGLVVLVIAALLVLHTNPVQRRVLDWSARELERRFNLDLTADDLHYNLVQRRVTMTNVRLAAGGHRDRPFFAAQAVSVRLPWVVFRGQLQFANVEVQEGRVLIHRDKNGVSNLPPGGAPRPPGAPPRRIDVRGLTVRNLEFRYRDERRDFEIVAPRVRTDLEYVAGEGARGPFAIGGNLIVAFDERRVVVEPVDGTVVFDGSNLALEDIRLRTVEASIAVNGEIPRVLDQPRLDLTLAGTVDLERGARWAAPPMRIAGTATLEGTMTGPPSEFVLDSRLSSRDATVGTATGVSIEAESRLTPDALTVSKAVIRPASGGEIRATTELPWGPEPWLVTAQYSGLDGQTAFRLAEVDPLPFGAALRGTARLGGRPGEPFRLEVHNSSSPRSTEGTAPLSGDIDFFVERNRWRATQKHTLGATAVSGAIGGVWNRDAVARSTFEGQLDVRASDVGDAARTASLFGFAAPGIIRNSRGPLDATVNLGGEFAAPRFYGTATTPGVEIPSFGPAAFSAQFDASPRAINITDVTGTVGTAHVEGEYLADLETRAVSGSFSVRAPSAADLVTGLPDALRLDGPLAAKALLSGTVDTPVVTANVEGTDLTLGNQPVDSLTAKVRVVDEEVFFDSVSLKQGPGFVDATGRYSISSGAYTVNLDGQGLRYEEVLGRFGNVNAVVGLSFSGSGTVDRPLGEGTIEFDLTGGPAEAVLGDGTVGVRLDGTSAFVKATVPALGATMEAKIALERPFGYEAVLNANTIDLAELVKLAGFETGEVKGTAGIFANANGTLEQASDSKAYINIHTLDAAIESVPLTLAEPSRMTWDGTGLVINWLDLGLGAEGRLRATGRLAVEATRETATFDASFNGELSDLVRIGHPFGLPPEIQASGMVQVAVKSTGGIDQATGSLQLTGGTAAWADIPAVRGLVIDASYESSTLNVTRLTGSWQGGSIEGTASIPRAIFDNDTGPVPATPGYAKLRVVGLSEQAFAPWVSRTTLASLAAHLSATLDTTITRASLEGLKGQLRLDEGNLIVAGVPVTQVQPSVFTFDSGTLTAEEVVWSFGGFASADVTAPAAGKGSVPGGGELSISGTARFAPVEKAALDFDIDGVADLRVLSAFAPTVAFGGTAKVDIGIGGSPESPVFSGRIDLAGAEVLIREPRLVISDLGGTIALDGQRVLFDSFRGTANGGDLIVEGGFLLTGVRPTGGALTVQLQRAALEYPDGLQSESDALLTLRPEASGFYLSGDVIVARSAFNEPLSLAALAAARRSRAPAPPGEEGRLANLRLNVFVSTREDLVVDNNYARLEAGGAIRLVGLANQPVIAGRVTLREGGEVFLAGRTFHVSRGSISFSNPNRIEPELDIELQTRVGNSDITLTLSGTLDRLQSDVSSSDPTVDSRDALTMIFGDIAGEDALTLLSAELLGATGRAIGLDTLRVERGFETDEFRADPGLIFTETDPSTRLTLAKRLRPDVEVTLSQSLRESGGLTAVVSYTPRRNIELRLISRDNLDRAVALRHEITFGGRTPGAGVQTPEPEVTAIQFTGDPRRPEQELRNLLRLNVGDRFDFHRWQQDLDRLRTSYQEQGFYEVRVRGSRETAPDQKTVTLTYDIERGPVTDLEIVGYEIDEALQNEIRESWRRSIFDSFLIEEVTARVQRHLIAENYIGSLVEVTIPISTPERKQLRIAVEPGSAVESREIVYTGHRAFRPRDFDAVIEQAGVEIDGWLDPPRIADVLQRFYRENGFLDATVRADRPEVMDRTARLPVTIDEGRRYTINAIRLNGVHPDRIVTIARAANLELGTPYASTVLEDARRRVQDQYGRLGFNEVSVEVEPVADQEEGAVDVSFHVVEGAQQIVREVATEGATRTRSGVIEGALNIRPGQPVDLAQWSLARKRLYDTNVFRQVDIDAVPVEPTEEEQAAGIEPVRAMVRVIEYPVWRLRYGLQLNDERTAIDTDAQDTREQNLGILADVRNQNLFGRAITAGIAGRFEVDRRSESIFLSNSSFFGLPLRTNAFIFDARQEFRQFDDEVTEIQDRRGFSAEQRWRPSWRTELTYGVRSERVHRFDPRPPPPGGFPPIDEVYRISKFIAAAYLDRRDDPFQPSRGWFSAVNFDQGLEFLRSDYGTSKLLVQQYYFRSFDRLVLATRAQAGVEFSDENLPPSERFLLGGATTVRGYAQNSLGPFDELLGPLGGESLLLFNAEARFPLRGWLQGVVFVDAGNVFEGKLVSFDDLKVGYGFGLRLASPFALLRADFGIPASPDRPGEPRSKARFYFGIGHIF